MAYSGAHGGDASSFDLPSTHRLPTVSAAQAAEQLDNDPSRFVSTGLEDLDTLLGSGLPAENAIANSEKYGGIERGQVTEIWGPPGVGKTSFGVQLATTALSDGQSAVWVDCSHTLSHHRLHAVAGHDDRERGVDPDGLSGFVHYTCPSVAHFVALLCRPSPSTISKTASVVVVDSLSALLNNAFPKMTDLKAGAGNAKGHSASSKRLHVLQYIIGALQKLAATRNVAVVILTQCATKMRADRGATLIPAINASVWEQGISTRIVLFRDWTIHGDRSLGIRLASIQKLGGRNIGVSSELVAFEIVLTGLVAVKYDASQSSTVLTPATKRKLADTDLEIADSEDDDYGWDEEEDTMPDPPSQWQGSEDILLGHQKHSDNEDAEESGDASEDEEEDADGVQPS